MAVFICSEAVYVIYFNVLNFDAIKVNFFFVRIEENLSFPPFFAKLPSVLLICHYSITMT